MNGGQFSNIATAMLVVNLAVFFGLFLLGGVVNLCLRRPLIPKKTIGIVGVVMVTLLYLVAALQGMAEQQGAVSNLPPYELGYLRGRIIGSVVTPAVLVLLVVGIVGLIGGKKNKSANKSVERTA